MYTNLAKQVLSLTEGKLNEWHGQKFQCYACDLAEKLYKEDLENGTFGYGRNAAFFWLRTYMEDLSMAEAWDEIKWTHGAINPFADPEKFQVLVFAEMAGALVRSSKTYLALLEADTSFIFTDELIDKIRKEWQEAIEL